MHFSYGGETAGFRRVPASERGLGTRASLKVHRDVSRCILRQIRNGRLKVAVGRAEFIDLAESKTRYIRTAAAAAATTAAVAAALTNSELSVSRLREPSFINEGRSPAGV